MDLIPDLYHKVTGLDFDRTPAILWKYFRFCMNTEILPCSRSRPLPPAHHSYRGTNHCVI
jgi:hypothetical protein